MTMSELMSYQMPNQPSKTSPKFMTVNKHSMPSMLVITNNTKMPINSQMPSQPSPRISMTLITSQNMPTHMNISPIDMPSLTANMTSLTTRLPRSVRSRGMMR